VRDIPPPPSREARSLMPASCAGTGRLSCHFLPGRNKAADTTPARDSAPLAVVGY